jgi:hypothetical protein
MFVSPGNSAARLCTLRRLQMKKRTIITRLQDQLAQEIKQADLSLIAAAKITICGGSGGVHAVGGDMAAV